MHQITDDVLRVIPLRASRRPAMKLYYATGTCSLAPHIVAREAGLALEIERVDIRSQPHRTQTGTDFTGINPKGYVPALRLDRS
jgi:glutathione S-transferase